jgi:Mg-chelatase subunit ChlD
MKDTRQEIIHVQSTNGAALNMGMGTVDIEENHLRKISNKAKRLNLILVDTVLPWEMKVCLEST